MLNQGKVEYNSVDANAHYSIDWFQSVWVPHHDQQPSQDYFKIRYRVHLAGVHNEATKEQINYVIGEEELLNKGPNGTLSLFLNGIKQFNRGEKHLKINCDNCVGQNKNNTVLWFCFYLVIYGYYETIELHFMIAGHTKFSPDRNAGMFKKLYRKSTIEKFKQFIEIIKKSSPAGYNKVQCYENGKGFQHYNFKVLEEFFKTLLNITKYHHFFFSADRLGVIKVKEFVDSEWEEFDLLKADGREREKVIEEIRNLVFLILPPKSLSSERLEYLHKEIRPLMGEKFWDIFASSELKCQQFNLI